VRRHAGAKTVGAEQDVGRRLEESVALSLTVDSEVAELRAGLTLRQEGRRHGQRRLSSTTRKRGKSRTRGVRERRACRRPETAANQSRIEGGGNDSGSDAWWGA